LSRDTNFSSSSSSSSSSFSQSLFLLKWRDDFFFVKEEKLPFFFLEREKEKKRQTSFTSKQQTFPPKTVSAFSSFARRPGTRGGSAKRCSFPFFLTRRPTNNARPAINWRARIERRR